MKNIYLTILAFTFFFRLNSQPLGIYDILISGLPQSEYFTRTGNVFNFYSRMHFQGNAIQYKCDTFYVGYFLSNDLLLTTQDVLVAKFKVNPFDYTVQSYTDCPVQNINLDVLGINSGTYYGGVIADYDNRLAESDETNNSYFFGGWTTPTPIVYSAPVGLINNALTNQVKIAQTSQGLIIETVTGEDLRVQLLSLDGRTVFSGSGNKLLITGNQPGIYILNIKSQAGEYRKKIVLNVN